MQYLLTEEEMQNLVSRIEVTRRDLALRESRQLILQLSHFTCIHERGRFGHGAYCDNCPIYTKFPAEINNKLLCDQPKNFSK